MRPPCFDEQTKTDCPDRKQGCAVNCEKWAKYLEARNAEYAERKKLGESNHDVNCLYYHNRELYLRRKAQRMSRRPRMRG